MYMWNSPASLPTPSLEDIIITQHPATALGGAHSPHLPSKKYVKKKIQLLSSYFSYPSSSFSTSQFFLADLVIFVVGFFTCSISLAIMFLFACVLDFLTWWKNVGSGSSKPKMSLTESKMRWRRVFSSNYCELT